MERFKPALTRRNKITKTGEMAHELVLVNNMLASHESNKTFSMSSEMVENCNERKEMLIVKLGLSEDKEVHSEEIKKIEEELTEKGYPYWKVIRPLP